MSIQFPTDNDAGMTRPGAPRRRGGGRFLFMLIFGVIAFMVIRGMRPQEPTLPIDGENVGSTSYPDLEQFPQQRADQADWGTGEGPVQRNTASESTNSRSNSSNSGFAMEDVTTTQNPQPTTGRLSQPAPKKTTNGDWGHEEVE